MPLILVTIFDEATGDCKWNWPKSWMGAANETTWLVLLAIIPLIVMTGLYSRVVYTLWFKRNDGQEPAFRQKVRLTKNSVENSEFFIKTLYFCLCNALISGHPRAMTLGTNGGIVRDLLTFVVNFWPGTGALDHFCTSEAKYMGKDPQGL